MWKTGDHVRMDGRSGVVVAVCPKGMFDIQFDDVDHVERRSGDRLMRKNGTKQLDIVDPRLEQFRAQVSGIYDSLVKKHKPRTVAERSKLKSRAFAIAVGVGRKHGYLEAEGIRPTRKGVLLSAARVGANKAALREMAGEDEHLLGLLGKRTAASSRARRSSYEEMLATGRKSGRVRVTGELRGGKVVEVLHPMGRRLVANPYDEDAKPRRPRDYHREALAEGRAKRSGDSPLGEEYRKYHPAPRGGVRSPPSAEMLESNFTPTMIFAVSPADDPDLKGYFVVTYDPRNRRVVNALSTVKGWVMAPNVTHVAFEKSSVEIMAGRGEQVVRKAPEVHKVIALGRGQYIVTGPKAKPEKSKFTSREAAEAHRLNLDMAAARFGVAQTHRVGLNPDGTYYISGPKADEEKFYADAEHAERVARALDRAEASSGAVPLVGKRTKIGASGAEAVRLVKELIQTFDNRSIHVKRSVNNAQMAQILRGPPKGTPAPEFLHLNLGELRASLIKRGMDEDEADEFVAEEKAKRQAFMPTRIQLEAGRTRIEKERTGRRPTEAEFAKGRRQPSVTEIQAELDKVRAKLRKNGRR